MRSTEEHSVYMVHVNIAHTWVHGLYNYPCTYMFIVLHTHAGT